ncbi:hypothetical protein [Desulfotruncus alcoholivorax]|uniref:hypothetical protein n=1 Tax=Desulfotruncus alcoholivorax TaxID=265477 RepID=UPI00040C2CDA|nr:hypothetical protein [Desulfotruncus alcoholivorax]
MVAVGNLVSVWTGVPGEDEQLFSVDFLHFFGLTWEKVLVGSEKTYTYHRFWDACFAVDSFERVQGTTIADLPVTPGGCTTQTRCNIIVG